MASRAAVLGGFSLHAGVAVAAHDRAGLERLCRYMGRPPLAADRLKRVADGRIVYRLRHRWRDGTSAVVFEPREFVARLAAQVPPPRAHQVRYHGILAPSAQWRARVVPAGSDGDAVGDDCRHRSGNQARRIAWSDLLRWVFAVDALACDRCGGKMRVLGTGRASAAVLAAMPALAGRPPPLTKSEIAG